MMARSLANEIKIKTQAWQARPVTKLQMDGKRGRKKKPSQQMAEERASSSTRTAQDARGTKRQSEGDDDARYSQDQDVDVGAVDRRHIESKNRKEAWDEDAMAMSKGFRLGWKVADRR